MESAKLSNSILPTNYDLFLEPSLENLTFKGKVKIKLNIKEQTEKIILHSLDLDIKEAIIESSPEIKVKVSLDSEKETLTLTLSKKISKIQTLTIDFSGKINDKLKGLYYARYKQNNKEKRLLTTQFEAPYARKCFPCFDEPSKKATFNLSLKIPSNLEAISNMPIKEENKEMGKKVISFQETPVMSTYLLYIGIGEFEYLQDTYNEVKLRIVTTPGKSKEGKFAMDLTKKCLKYFEDFSEIPYPLPKLDMLAIPDFEAGAMENWGAITYREILLLQNEKTSLGIKKRIAEVIAHELWHQWSGNLVTMEWWEDLWLNESFATYMAYKAMDHYFPDWKSIEDFVSDETSGAFGMDSLKSTHSIAVKVNNPNEIEEIFDEISYGKGGSVLRMIESFLGHENFRKGVSQYLKKYEYKNAIASDLWDNLANFSEEPIKEVMIDWLNKSGYPIIETSRKNNKLILKQKKFNSNEKTIWKIPLTIKTEESTIKDLFNKESQEMELKTEWYKLNENQAGFYRTKYDKESLNALSLLILNKKLSPLDRFGIQNDLFYLCLYNEITIDAYLNFLKNYKNEDSYLVLADIYVNLREIQRTFEKEKDINWGKFNQIIAEPYKNKIKQLSYLPKKNESQEDTFTRALSINYLQFSKDKETLEFCKKSFKSFLKDSNSLHPDIKGPVLAAISENGAEEEYKEMQNYYEKTENVEEKTKVLSSLFRFQDEKILKQALNYSLTDKVRLQDLRSVFAVTESNPKAESFFFDWAMKNWSKLKPFEKNPYVFMGIIESLILISGKNKEKVKEFVKKEKVKYKTTIANAFESLETHENWFDKNKEILKSYLKNN